MILRRPSMAAELLHDSGNDEVGCASGHLRLAGACVVGGICLCCGGAISIHLQQRRGMRQEICYILRDHPNMTAMRIGEPVPLCTGQGVENKSWSCKAGRSASLGISMKRQYNNTPNAILNPKKSGYP